MSSIDRCLESWRLWREVELQQLVAIDAGYSIPEYYKPYDLAFKNYQAHFKTCPQCRAWVDNWEKEGAVK